MSNVSTPIADAVFSSFEIDQSYLPDGQSDDERFQQLRKILIRRIEELIEKDIEKLKWILYRIDVSEKKVHEALASNAALHYPDILADLIIERQIEKAESRKKFSDGSPADWSFDM
jgi:hypothetical protein